MCRFSKVHEKFSIVLKNNGITIALLQSYDNALQQLQSYHNALEKSHIVEIYLESHSFHRKRRTNLFRTLA